jgi:DNA-binding LacI/PurR family transcriptional regulator
MHFADTVAVRTGSFGQPIGVDVGIKTLASQLNLSIATVSRALNSSGPVSAKTRKRVLDAAAALGYSPNMSAGNLRKGRIDAIGLMLPLFTQGESFSASLFMPLADGIQTVLLKHKLDLAIFQGHSSEGELTQIKRIVGRHQVDGLIVSNTRRHDPRLDFLARQDFPFLAFGRSESGRECAWIDLDMEGAAEQAVERLVSFNHRRIAVVTPGLDAMQAYIYLKSYKRALRRLHIPFDPSLVRQGEFSERGGYRAAESLLAGSTRPSAIIFQSDCMAIGAYRKLHELSLTPGKEIAIIAGVLTGEVQDYLSPRMTGFTLTIRELGMRMAEAMLARLPGIGEYYNNALAQEIWPLQLRVRQSDGQALGPQA